MAPTGPTPAAERAALPAATANRMERRRSSRRRADNGNNTTTEEEATQFEEEEEDRDDKSWRTRGESSPSMANMASPRPLTVDHVPLSWDSAATSARQRQLQSQQRPERRKRLLFWRNVVRQYNFVDQEHERARLLSLTQGIDWVTMAALPFAFMARHKEIYHLICRADYERSSMIQRDVTRTFSIFEQSQLPRRERDVNAQQRALFRVLNAVAEAEDGYCQGMNFIAALFLVEGLDEEDSYALFLYLLQTRQLARIYHHSSTFLDDYLHHFERMFQAELPDLYAHMQAQGFAIPMYGIEWFTTLFSLSTKPELACAIFDLFFVGVEDIFLRMGLAILKLLEASLMCMSFEDFLREFKPLVRQIDPYLAVLKALSFQPNPHVAAGEDTTDHIAREHYLRIADQGNAITTRDGSTIVKPPRAFQLHRSLPPELGDAIQNGDVAHVSSLWLSMTAQRETPLHWLVLTNEILHSAVWHGHVPIACFAIRQCGADVDNADDTGLTPLHFAVLRNQPDLVRLLLCCGAARSVRGGRWRGAERGLSPLKTAQYWKCGDTAAARLVLEREVCLCCNTRFDAFAFHRETCVKCTFTFCGRGPDPCIERHQCPAKYRMWRERLQRQQQEQQQEQDQVDERATDDTSWHVPNDAVGSDTLDLTSTDASSALSSSSSTSRRSSRSMSSETLSSFVYIKSPASDLPADRLQSARTGTNVSTTTTGGGVTPSSTGLFSPLVDWIKARTRASSDDAGEDSAGEDSDWDTVEVRGSIEFPNRPQWYCKARHCHAVFTFFARRDECSRCLALYCSNHFDATCALCHSCTGQSDTRTQT